MTALEPIRLYLGELQAQGRTTVRLADVLAATGVPRRPALRVLDKLAAEGYLRELADGRVYTGKAAHGPIPRDPTWGLKSKPLRRRPKAKPHRNTLRDRLYRLIRARRRFTRGDLQVLSGASERSVAQYVAILEREGLVRRAGVRGREVQFLLVKDPGPERPRLPEEVPS